MTAVMLKIFDKPPINRREILRYAGCKASDSSTEALLDGCIAEAEGCLVYKVCYSETNVGIHNGICLFDGFEVSSKGLASNLAGCQRAVILGATVGVGLDRLIAKYSLLSPARAVMLQALGAERIESLCDLFCRWYEAERNVGLKPRFSPGYGDLSLECQKDIFSRLDLTKHLGVTLNGSLLMSPSKSVTAFAGITDEKYYNCNRDKCTYCENKGCAYRG